MRFWVALAIITALSWPAYAQRQTPQPAPGQPPKTPQEIEADKAADRAYQKSLRNIPDQPAADPWGNARSTDAPKTTDKAAAKTEAKTAKSKSATKPSAN
jgi:cytoskeletal protein RodZ